MPLKWRSIHTDISSQLIAAVPSRASSATRTSSAGLRVPQSWRTVSDRHSCGLLVSGQHRDHSDGHTGPSTVHQTQAYNRHWMEAHQQCQLLTPGHRRDHQRTADRCRCATGSEKSSQKCSTANIGTHSI